MKHLEVVNLKFFKKYNTSLFLLVQIIKLFIQFKKQKLIKISFLKDKS